VAQQGSAAVTKTVEGINHMKGLMESVAESIIRLSEQTQAIGEIITAVSDLAQQSNLLAVNAAIEASKAGEHGKGFSVVAQEIKSLADQSKQATEQVRAILGDIQKATGASVMAAEQVSKAVDGGVKQAAESGESIKKLAESIAESAQAATQIAASSQQQFVGMDQIALAMENVKQASQQSVSATKQAEQAAQNLHALGQKLKEMVGKYKV
jgi:methyl-accepting chemotaxis protein